ncbi:MAG: hypothetical protein ACRC1P_09720 [Cellulosilyticaceae bacterium]
MNRWLVTKPDGLQLKLYYPNMVAATERNPNCTIEEYIDQTYLRYVGSILESATEFIVDFKGRKLYKIPHNSGYILVRLAFDEEDNTYYDFLEYQRRDENTMITPITFTWSTPKEFYELFLEEPGKSKDFIRLSNRELKKIKPTKFYNKNNRAFWFDKNGYFYYADKSALPGKKDKEEYEKFKDNPKAVFVKWDVPLKHSWKIGWFESFDVFMDEFKKVQEETPVSFATPRYDILRYGYTKKHPDDRGAIFRFPHFDIEKEYIVADTLNDKSRYHKMAGAWAKMLEGKKYAGDWFDQIELFEDLINRYYEYRSR